MREIAIVLGVWGVVGRPELGSGERGGVDALKRRDARDTVPFSGCY